ncbi:MAG TPA: Maf family protein [Lachnospiraceae bacterium]|nr:Maf family protein [Lachnospiraceae bacterium]
MNQIILASASPRRQELLTQIGLYFEVVKSTCEEEIHSSNPSEVVCNLSRKKARDVWEKKRQELIEKENPNYNMIVIGADTIVSCEGEILGKPKDKEDACRMLRKLSGRSHEVFTGVTFCYREKEVDKVYTFFERTEVEFYQMNQQEITAYVESKDPLDKAGAYGIQGKCASYIKGIRGDYNNVVGLPIGRLYQELKECKLI